MLTPELDYRVNCVDCRMGLAVTVKTIGAQDSLVHLNFEHMPAIDAGLPQISKPCLKFRHKRSQYRLDTLLAKLDWQ